MRLWGFLHLLGLLRHRSGSLQMLRRGGAGRWYCNGYRGGLGVWLGRSLHGSARHRRLTWGLVMVWGLLLLLLLRLLNRSLRPRSRMWSVALGWRRRLLLARMVVHVLR